MVVSFMVHLSAKPRLLRREKQTGKEVFVGADCPGGRASVSESPLHGYTAIEVEDGGPTIPVDLRGSAASDPCTEDAGAWSQFHSISSLIFSELDCGTVRIDCNLFSRARSCYSEYPCEYNNEPGAAAPGAGAGRRMVFVSISPLPTEGRLRWCAGRHRHLHPPTINLITTIHSMMRSVNKSLVCPVGLRLTHCPGPPADQNLDLPGACRQVLEHMRTRPR